MAQGDEDVRAQYESYPYPARDPADEARRLITGSPSHVLEIEHFVRGGSKAGDLNALIAGGGTGDAAVMLAQQLADRGQGRVTYIDVSSASLAVARARAEARGLTNIRFLQGSLLEVGELAPGPYDYIDCCGVLHHLAEPLEGLNALVAQLSPAGGLGCMLYGPLGRTGVYPMQSALRRLAGNANDRQRLAIARKLLAAVPDSNWLKRNPWLGDHLGGDDAGLYDLLLHPRDRAFSVAEIQELLAAANLRLAAFFPPAQYDPGIYLSDPDLAASARALPDGEQAALAEELSGAMKTHVFYALPAESPVVAPVIGPDAVPALKHSDAASFGAQLSQSKILTATVGEIRARLPVPEMAGGIVALIDGKRTLRQIHGRLRAGGHKLDWASFSACFSEVHALLHPLGLLLVRDGGQPR